MTKLVGLGDATASEVAKTTQAPTAAPSRFRRLRSGKGFLPARCGTSEGWTGALIRRQVCNDGMPVVLPLHNVSLEHAANVRDACELEDRIWQEEDETLWRKRTVVARHGPQAVSGRRVQYFDGDKRLDDDEGALLSKRKRGGRAHLPARPPDEGLRAPCMWHGHWVATPAPA